ncbi:MarR family transcriptional regulator [Vibrio vulnificus]|uniref:MarR family winged helix-turn-helix transcriptional regulator n=1 Tax=Vibrio vulnificus TaxID=672 RepID=UPI00102B12D9|nr:MarR family transcriptional regulator [Vibrio vulnificus]RZR10643.1 MarR family transcriptional regulator [Vibrio vulnificus]
MILSTHLEKMERFAAKVWRKHSKDDPILQLSFSEYDYLKVIQNAQEPIRITDLALEMEVSKPSATNMVTRLERKGLVSRAHCLHDARVKRVALTEKALHYLAQEAMVYRILAEQVAGQLSDEEQQQLVSLLSKALTF